MCHNYMCLTGILGLAERLVSKEQGQRENMRGLRRHPSDVPELYFLSQGLGLEEGSKLSAHHWAAASSL